ncbi:MAG: hypothetical protein Q4D85_08610 [Corynebacterium sp.]|uniref:hypothetical protein n=1 Tax=Corynebacterium sp. TaxID=1720 RepID=UPI0026DB4E25|nr:hypothetical protein [Corynebacterium sp.]MDO5098808.1 hypothetical protein [Corynebacterium sp.]
MNHPAKSLSSTYPIIDLRSLARSNADAIKKLPDNVNYVRLSATHIIDQEAFADIPPWERLRLRALLIASSRKTAVMGTHGAAAILGIPFLGKAKGMEKFDIFLRGATRPTARSRWPLGTTMRSGILPEKNIMFCDGIAITAPARTFVDLCRFYGPAEGLAFAEAAIQSQLLSTRGISADYFRLATADMPRLRGIPTAHLALEHLEVGAQSVHETHARWLLVQAKIRGEAPQIKSIEIQKRINTSEGPKYPDILINGWCIVEIDGDSKYIYKTQHTLMAERRRERLLQRQGFTFLRFRPTEIGAGMVREIIANLERRSQPTSTPVRNEAA